MTPSTCGASVCLACTVASRSRRSATQNRSEPDFLPIGNGLSPVDDCLTRWPESFLSLLFWLTRAQPCCGACLDRGWRLHGRYAVALRVCSDVASQAAGCLESLLRHHC
jgi:hypothetical protein